VGRDEDAVRVACEVVRSKGGDRELANRLEALSIKTKNLDALSIAHDLLARDLTGADRAEELVRQAEGRVKAGSPHAEAVQHGESGLTSVPPDEVEPLLARLVALAETPGEVVDLYERQITRCKAPADRVKALARAAQAAGAHDQLDRARGFFDLALAGTPGEDALVALEDAARETDVKVGQKRLRRALCDALAGAGQGARDGGRTRGGLLRRAAQLAHSDLDDVEQGFAWLGEALITHVEPATLDALENLARQIGDLRRAEGTISKALEEVFDGPLVRQLLARRAKLRRSDLNDARGAASDLKKLHDLSPSDQAVADELSALLTSLGDFRGLVQLYEDQILRGKDTAVRAELARKVARMWEEELSDPREAADAWRRVLRLKQGDPDAVAGLERAKVNMLKKPEPPSEHEVVPPPPPSSRPEAAPPLLKSDVQALSADGPADEPSDAGLPPPPSSDNDLTPLPASPLGREVSDAPPFTASAHHDASPAAKAGAESRGSRPASAVDFDHAHAAVVPPAAPLGLDLPGDSGVPPATPSEDVVFDEDTVAADDLIMEVEDQAAAPAPPEEAKKPSVPAKRSIPPPLPRS
jgi:tetratricopeptide (TPR) repeat protein